MISYQTFKELLLKQLKTHFDHTYKLEVHKITKNNQLELDGLCILPKGETIAPTIYLNDYYKDYIKGVALTDISNAIVDLYHNCPKLEQMDIKLLKDFSNLKDRIAYKLVHFKKNEQLLAKVPHIPYLDLAIVFYCVLDHSPEHHASFLIYNEHLSGWGINDRDLYETAILNTPRLLPCELMNMASVIQDFCEIDETDINDCQMFILTNNRRTFGASCILYEDNLKDIATRFHSSLYILPSSIHEVIIIPATDKSNSRFYSQIVSEVNDSMLLHEEVLSDHAYFYDRKKQALMCC